MSKHEDLVKRAAEFAASINQLDVETNVPVSEKPAPVGFSPSFDFSAWPERKADFREKALTYVETYYWTHKRLPNKEDFEAEFNSSELPTDIEGWKQLLLSLQEALANRGIPAFYLPKEQLDAKFVLAVNFIANHHDKRNVAAKLKEVGLTTKQFKGLLAQPQYLEYYKNRIAEVFEDQAPIDAKIGMSKLMADGDLPAIKFYYELQNIYRPQTSANFMVMQMLQLIMEILSKHVTPAVLTQIAGELKTANIIEVQENEALPSLLLDQRTPSA